MIEDDFDIPFVADLAFREKQIQQNYRPVIAVHKWFARRPGSLFRSLLISEFSSEPLRIAYRTAQNFRGKVVLDPFMGGGTPIIEANRIGCNVIGNDLNPMAFWIVSQELAPLDLKEYSTAADALRANLERLIGDLYRTTCAQCGNSDAHVKYFLWVKTASCPACEEPVRLLPSQMVAKNQRHPNYVVVCHACGELNELPSLDTLGRCCKCSVALLLKGSTKRNHYCCPSCDTVFKRAPGADTPLRHSMLAIEYHCPECRARPEFRGRLFKTPDRRDLNNYRRSEEALASLRPKYVPTARIPDGDETKRLHRWGYSKFSELFNARQTLGLELSARHIAQQKEEAVRCALATNFSDLLRYQNMLCRYDTMALKALDIFSVHGFPVGLVQCESNLLGIQDANKASVSVGSGGWRNITEKFAKAKAYCINPFEILQVGGRKVTVPITGESISTDGKCVVLSCKDSALLEVRANSVDAVLTDPPYYANVQYAELMDFCYVWLKRLLGASVSAFDREHLGSPSELTANETSGKGAAHFTEGLAKVYSRAATAMKSEGVFAFTYHHNRIDAYSPVAVALLDAGLVCTRAIPCPAEMGGSIHINGTTSSIVDTVFVCRKKAHPRAKQAASVSPTPIDQTKHDLFALLEANLQISKGDIRCIIFGNVVASVVNTLSNRWPETAPTATKLRAVAAEVHVHLGSHPNEKATEIASMLHDEIVATSGQLKFAL